MNRTISMRVTTVATVLVATLSASSSVRAQQNGVSPSACYVPGSGTIYVIKQTDTPASCKAGHVEVTRAPSTTASKTVMAAAGGGNGLPTNSQGAFDLSNVDGLVAAGTWGTGNIPVSGAGTRLMWYPRMAALRAGIVGGTQWDNPNVGSGSVAFGFSTTASGQYALAAGNNSIASGNAAFAIGEQSSAIGAAAAGIGYMAKASGTRSIALGSETWASGVNAVAMGFGAVASGFHGVAIGFQSTASGSTAVAIGDATASGFEAIAMGSAAEATGSFSMALGYDVVASGNYSTAMGRHAHTNGKVGAFVYGDATPDASTKATANDQFAVRAQRIWFGKSGDATATTGRYIETSTGAYLSNGGAWVSSSDSTRKHLWQDVDGEAVLGRLSAMPVRSWSYRAEGDSVRHLGPTAQEFHAAFGLGDTDKAIATVDADGVSLVAIKALAQRTINLQRDNAELRALLGDALRRLTALETGRR